MENHKLVVPQHLNQYGYLFGGYMLQWVDECAWIAATLDYPDCSFVTIGMDKVEFRESVKQGTLLRIQATRVREGNTSVQYEAKAFRGMVEGEKSPLVFSTNITFVNIDKQGNKARLPRKKTDC